ncbi:MAG: hypothetical protein P8X73_05105 [Ignavibacteriaceae bacterium]|jgi:hypothetical protein
MLNKEQFLKLIITRFPNHQNCIKELFEESESFRSLCEDYFDCRTVLDETIKNSNKSSDLQKEYQVMLSEIEDELIERITI